VASPTSPPPLLHNKRQTSQVDPAAPTCRGRRADNADARTDRHVFHASDTTAAAAGTDEPRSGQIRLHAINTVDGPQVVGVVRASGPVGPRVVRPPPGASRIVLQASTGSQSVLKFLHGLRRLDSGLAARAERPTASRAGSLSSPAPTYSSSTQPSRGDRWSEVSCRSDSARKTPAICCSADEMVSKSSEAVD
jgi:hypothetical protein